MIDLLLWWLTIWFFLLNCYLCKPSQKVTHIFKNGNNTEEISMALPKDDTINLWKLPYFSITTSRGGTGRKVVRRIQEQGIRVYLLLIHADVSLKAIQYCKAITLQLNTTNLIIKTFIEDYIMCSDIHCMTKEDLTETDGATIIG